MTEYVWEKSSDEHYSSIWRCYTKEALVDLYPRPSYCDRGRWQAFIVCAGFPINPNPFDIHDGFPRYYFDLERAKAESGVMSP